MNADVIRVNFLFQTLLNPEELTVQIRCNKTGSKSVSVSHGASLVTLTTKLILCQ